MSMVESVGGRTDVPAMDHPAGISLAERARQSLHGITGAVPSEGGTGPCDETETPPEESDEKEKEPLTEEEIALRLAFSRIWARELFRELVFFSSEEQSGVPELSIDI